MPVRERQEIQAVLRTGGLGRIMDMIKSLAVAIILCSALSAAPVPLPKPRPPEQPGRGLWVMTWGGSTWQASLAADGAYEATRDGARWYGSWSWSSQSRMLLLHETIGGETWLTWTIRMEPTTLAGKTESGIAVVFERSK
mgnify:CR=1 FL=1